MAPTDVTQLPTNVLPFPAINAAAEEMPDKSPALLFALLIWYELPAARRNRIMDRLRDRAGSPAADSATVQLYNFLKRA